MLRTVAWVLLVGLMLLPQSPVAARGESPPTEGVVVRADTPDTISTWQVHTLRVGEQLSGSAGWEAVARVNRVLNPALLRPGQELRVPSGAVTSSFVAAHSVDTPLALAVRHDVRLWQLLRHNPSPLYAGKGVVLPNAAPVDGWPYPLVDVQLAPAQVVRGRTALLVLETAHPATCEVTYAGRTEPCYPLGDARLYALLGFSALMDPGDYILDVRVQAGGLETVVDLPVQVHAGRYGYQFIDPPARLHQLMDPRLMQGELDYLATWRTVRTPARAWQFPLDFPLPVRVSISADYGDRRSYGGMVSGYHSGVDYRAWTGMPVLAPADGVVLMAERLAARGNALLIDHGWGLVTGYWHLSRIDVRVGERVRRGQPVALVGNTGLSTGSHLHWELWVNGVSVDAKQWLTPDGFDAALPPLPPAAEAPESDPPDVH